MTPGELARKINVSLPQVYKWNREGVSEKSKYVKQLTTLLPELPLTSSTLKKNGETDNRVNSGRKQKELVLTETDIATVTGHNKEFKSTLFPKIIFKTKGE